MGGQGGGEAMVLEPSGGGSAECVEVLVLELVRMGRRLQTVFPSSVVVEAAAECIIGR